MRKFLVLTGIFFFTAAYLVALKPDWMKAIYNSGMLPNLYETHGDLYNMSRLPGYAEFHPACQYTPPKTERKKKVRLVIIGDSYTEHFTTADFSADKYDRVHWDDQLSTTIDTAYYNVLVIQTAERFISRFAQPCTSLVVTNPPSPSPVIQKLESGLFRLDKIINFIFNNANIDSAINPFFINKSMEQNIEFLLLNNPFANRMKEIKAGINLHWWNRLSWGITVSTKKKQLYFTMTTDSTDSHSSFYPIPDNVIDDQVKGMNELSEKYKTAGFNRVVFSIIPNTVSIIEPDFGNYNHQIERVQSSGLLHVEYIDGYSVFKQMGESAFYFNDTHWNCDGRAAWLDLVNKNVLVIN